MRGKNVSVGANRATYTLNGDVKWSAWASARYTDDERDWATCYCQAD